MSRLFVCLQADKRAHHNALERKRRDHIKDSFHGLRDSVPALQGEKVSRRVFFFLVQTAWMFADLNCLMKTTKTDQELSWAIVPSS